MAHCEHYSSHRYIRCPICGYVDPAARMRCQGCQKLIPPAEKCPHCGKACDLQLDTKRRGPDATGTGWGELLLPMPFFVIGGAFWFFDWPIVMIGSLVVGLLLSALITPGIIRRLTPKMTCPKCTAPLPTSLAKQCFKCGYDWRDAQAPPQ